jgi:hypothetical protein
VRSGLKKEKMEEGRQNNKETKLRRERREKNGNKEER